MSVESAFQRLEALIGPPLSRYQDLVLAIGREDPRSPNSREGKDLVDLEARGLAVLGRNADGSVYMTERTAAGVDATFGS